MYKKCFDILKIAGAALMLLLVICSLADTWYMMPQGEEISLRKWDSIPANLAAAALCVSLFFGAVRLEEKFAEKSLKIFSEAAAAFTALWIFGASLWWIFSSERLPVGDQAFIYGGASYFSQGDYSFLRRGGYCHIYPYQLGLISLVELLYHVASPFSYRPLQVINALAAAGIVYTGYRLVREWCDGFLAGVMYCLLAGLCLPLVFYTPWVYGDLVSIFLGLLAALFLCRYERKKKVRDLVGLAFSLTLAQLVRQTTAILYIALCLVVLVHISQKRDRRLLMAAAVSILLSLSLFSAVYRMYEYRSGEESSKGIPVEVTLAMGLQESRQGCGWDNNYQKEVYNRALSDYDKMKEIGRADLEKELGYLAKNPVYAARFYAKKILSQWNAPLYQSLFFTADYRTGQPPGEGSLAESVTERYFWDVLNVCDRVQFVVYLGMLFWFLLAVKKDRGMLRHFLAAAVAGGFCFSLLWEAKTRYILPYYLFMFPCAAAGYWEFGLQLAHRSVYKTISARPDCNNCWGKNIVKYCKSHFFKI